MTRKPVSTRSSGNPFADLHMADADTRLAKAKLAQRITADMREHHLTQAQVASKLGIDQPQVSRITRGQLADFSLEKLLALVNRLNMDVEINVIPNPEPDRRPHLVVRYPEEMPATSRVRAAASASRSQRSRKAL
jgi:predicted XRE-type DNA-binding protein